MKRTGLLVPVLVVLCACASESPTYDPLLDYEQLTATTILDAPSAVAGNYAPSDRGLVEHGEYLVELLGCGVCHTDGALEGAADMEKSLAGSRTGIAYSNPLSEQYPGVVYPPNITPDEKSGIGSWTDQQIENAIMAGLGRHISRRIASMPWQGYAKLSDDDARAIVMYLRSIKPISHRVPDDVKPGDEAAEPFIYFGVYRSRD
jgi:mono/diheme cytochrome c family protein